MRALLLSCCLTVVASCAPAATNPGPAAPPVADPGGAASIASSPAAPTLLPVRVSWAAPGGALAPVWVAYEQGLLREEGLDAELVYLSGTRTDQGVVTGDTPIGFGANVIPTRLGGADLVAIAGVVNEMPYVLFARPGIASPQELRGGTVVVGIPGSSVNSATLIALGSFGLDPGRDVHIQPTQGPTEELAILSQGLADGAFFSPPGNFQALDLGLVPLANMAERHIPFMLTAIGVTPAYARSNPEEIRRFLRGYVRAVVAMRRQPEQTKAIIGKYTQTEDQAVLDKTYDYYQPLWGRPDFRVRPDAVESILKVMDAPGVESARADEFVDNRFIDELHASGFVQQVGGMD